MKEPAQTDSETLADTETGPIYNKDGAPPLVHAVKKKMQRHAANKRKTVATKQKTLGMSAYQKVAMNKAVSPKVAKEMQGKNAALIEL